MMRNPRSVGFMSRKARLMPARVASSPGVVEEGKPAPDFELESDSGETVRLSDLRGKPVVLYFYPKDDTPGCTRQACGIRDAWGEFQRAGAEVFGISADDQASHERFKSKYELPFTLLADPEHTLARAVRRRRRRARRPYERSTFVIDADGNVAKIMRRVNPDSTRTTCSPRSSSALPRPQTADVPSRAALTSSNGLAKPVALR